jgi:hypothetical protein
MSFNIFIISFNLVFVFITIYFFPKISSISIKKRVIWKLKKKKLIVNFVQGINIQFLELVGLVYKIIKKD